MFSKLLRKKPKKGSSSNSGGGDGGVVEVDSMGSLAGGMPALKQRRAQLRNEELKRKLNCNKNLCLNGENSILFSN